MRNLIYGNLIPTPLFIQKVVSVGMYTNSPPPPPPTQNPKIINFFILRILTASEPLINNTLQMMSLHLPTVGLWWRIALVQSGKQSSSSHSKYRYSRCSDPVLRNSGVLSNSVTNRTTEPTRGWFPHLLLLLSGDVETNPGPSPGMHCSYHAEIVRKYH